MSPLISLVVVFPYFQEDNAAEGFKEKTRRYQTVSDSWETDCLLGFDLR